MKAKTPLYFLLLFISVAISYLLSLTKPDLDKMEMAGILNYSVPAITGLLSLIILSVFIFLLGNFYQRKETAILISLLTFNISAGIALHYL